MVGQPGPVREHVADVDHLGDDRVGQREPRQLRHDRACPSRSRSRRPGGPPPWRRSTWTATPAGRPCPGRPFHPLFDILDAKALGVDGLSAVHDRDRHSGDAGLLHQIVGDAVELGDRVLDGVLRQWHRGHQRRRHIGQRRRRLLRRRLSALRRVRNRTPPRSETAARERDERANARAGSDHSQHASRLSLPPRVTPTGRSPSCDGAVGSTRWPGRGTTTSTPAGSAAASSRSMGSAHGCGASRNVAQWIGSNRPSGFGDVDGGPHRVFGVHVNVGPAGVVRADRQQR